MEWPKISIVTPSYNQAQFLERTICSVLDQNYPNLEYIIIDGGSTDGSLDIIRKYESRLAYWVSEPDRGQAHALNKGFRVATGDIIGWLNSDDMYCPGAFNLVSSALSENPEFCACYGGIFIIDCNDQILNALWPVKPEPTYNFHVGLSIHQQGLFWRSSVFHRIGYLDESLHFAMDLDFILRILIYVRLFRIKRHLGKFRLHAEAKTSNLKEVSRREHDLICSRYAADFEQELPGWLNRLILRSRHLLRVIEDAPITYLLFKLERLLGYSAKPRWHND